MAPKEVKQQYKPWISKEFLNSIRIREKLYKKFVKAKDKDVKEDYHKKYKQIRNKILSECREIKKLYFQNYFTENANNIKNMWKGIKSIINTSNYSKGQPSSLLVNKELISDPKLVAETFNNYFSSIASQLLGKIHQHGKKCSCHLKNSNPNDFCIKPTHLIEVINTINNLSPNKAMGPNSIPMDIFHLIKLSIAQPLVDIVNLSFEKGSYIEKLAISKVIPIFKDKGSYLEFTNYRPISLLKSKQNNRKTNA